MTGHQPPSPAVPSPRAVAQGPGALPALAFITRACEEIRDGWGNPSGKCGRHRWGIPGNAASSPHPSHHPWCGGTIGEKKG